MATFTKLRNGSWGLRVEGSVSPGTTVEVVKKSGEKQSKIIGKVLWTGTDKKTGKTISLCTMKSSSGRRKSYRSYSHGGGCHTDDNCSSMCPQNSSCPCWDGGWFNCC